MIKTILAAAAGDASDAATFAAALSVARSFGAHLDVLHVRFDPVNSAVAMSTDVGSGALTVGLIDQLERDAREREAAAQAAFGRFCADAGLAVPGTPASGQAAPSAEWHAETGEEARWIASYGRTADLIVASRPAAAEDASRAMIETALLETGRPLLIPAGAAMPASIERVAIAWKPTAQAARAVSLAMPFIERAREVIVCTVAENDDEHADTDRLVRNLAWHGRTARAERLKAGPGGAAATLLSAITGRADLLVMGGYGHGQLREWIFGGFTEHVLADAPLPVLMAH